MTFNNLVSNMRERIRRGLGRGSEQIEVAQQGTGLELLGSAPMSTPLVDVYENDNEFLIYADVPGGTREGATVAWDEARGLTFLVRGQELPSGAPWASEYRPSDFYRAVELPDYVDGARASSTLKDGVLMIRVPKRNATPKRIPVRAG
jgi:HSP20 family protein